MQEKSAGILIYRKNKNTNILEVLLGKMGGPYWENRNSNVWNIPKGHIELDEDILTCALREFNEETGLVIPAEYINKLQYLGETKTSKNKKIVYIYSLEYDFAPDKYDVEIMSNLFELEYPKGSGIIINVPELSKAKYFDINAAYKYIFSYQQVFLDLLKEKLQVN